MKTSAIAALAAFLPCLLLASPAPPPLPTVDLGYEIYRANWRNEAAGLYSFSNIRYAAPPTGENRFRAPQPPAQNRSAVQEVDRPAPLCPSLPEQRGWDVLSDYVKNYTELGQRSFEPSDIEDIRGYNGSLIEDMQPIDPKSVKPSAMYSREPMNPDTTEDCLFLDVVVPDHIFKRNIKSKRGAAVLAFLHGGTFEFVPSIQAILLLDPLGLFALYLVPSRSYIFGSKPDAPEGLMIRSQEGDNDGMIFVGLNYRLGAFGWLSGPTLQKDGTANAGLHDQRFALEWIQKHISKFGGDPERVTLTGHSAGGGSVMGQITAYGGAKGPVPFNQAIVASGGQLPMVGPLQQERVFQKFLGLLNVSSIQEARELPTENLQMANVMSLYTSAHPVTLYGLASDDDILPALPSQLLAEGRFDKDLKVMSSYVQHEATALINPFIKNSSDLRRFTSHLYPSFDQQKLDYVTTTLYPPVFDGSQAQGYTNELERAAALVHESALACNTFHLNKAFHNQTYTYVESLFPATHGTDWARLFGNSKSAHDTTLQRYISNFVLKGNPNDEIEPYWSTYGENATVQNLNDPIDQATLNVKTIARLSEQKKPLILTPSTGYLQQLGIVPMEDPAANQRCNWWQKAFDV